MLEKIILAHVAPGTHIITDGWPAYRHLEEIGSPHNLFMLYLCFFIVLVVCCCHPYIAGYKWSWVNHDKHCVDPETGDHTNKIVAHRCTIFLCHLDLEI